MHYHYHYLFIIKYASVEVKAFNIQLIAFDVQSICFQLRALVTWDPKIKVVSNTIIIIQYAGDYWQWF